MQRVYRLAIAFHVAVLSLVFPVTRIFDASLPHRVDYSYWLYNCTTIDQGLRDSWQMWVYNPYVAAGYPEGAVAAHLAHHGGRSWEMATHLLAPFSFAVAFKAFPFLCMLAGPLLMGVTAALLAFSAAETAIVGTLAIADWWGSNLAEIAVENGTVCFQLALVGSLVVVALLSRFFVSRRWTEAVTLLASSILFFWIHPLLLIFAGIPGLALYAVSFPALSPRDHLTLILIAVLTALAALPWLVPPLTMSFQDLAAHAYPFAHSYGVLGLLRTALDRRTILGRQRSARDLLDVRRGVAVRPGHRLVRRSGDAHLYNIGWVVAESDESVRYYDTHPDLFAPQGRIGNAIRLYGVKRPLSFFASGHGSIEATYNRIRLHDVQGEVVLKYHWVRTLRSSDGSPLRPVRLLRDPNPFIEASPRGSDLTIDNSYRLFN